MGALAADRDEHGVRVFLPLCDPGAPLDPSHMIWLTPSDVAARAAGKGVGAVRVDGDTFQAWLMQAVHADYVEAVYGTKRSWRLAVRYSLVRLKWEHDALHLGLRQDAARRFVATVSQVDDVTEAGPAPLQPYDVGDPELATRLGLGDS